MDIAKNMVDYITKTAEQEKILALKAVMGDPRSPKLAPHLVRPGLHHRFLPSLRIRPGHAARDPKFLAADGTLVLIDFKRIEGVSNEGVSKCSPSFHTGRKLGSSEKIVG